MRLRCGCEIDVDTNGALAMQARSDVEVQAEGGVADDLVEVAHGEVVRADVSYGGPRRGVDVEAGVFAELADAKEVGCVGDDDDMVGVVFAGGGGGAVERVT